MSTNPLVSVITPSYNQADYLENTIRSVLLQDYEPMEYLIVDGSSTDNSVEIIRKYAELAPERLSWWISEPDTGQAEAINKGFKRATGDIVAWLNSDDIYLPGAVQNAVAALEVAPEVGFVYSNAITIDADGKPLKRLKFGDWGLSELKAFRIICQPSVFIRREALERAGYLDTDYLYMLDHHLWIRIAQQAAIRHANPRDYGTWAAARHHEMAKNVAQAESFSGEILRLQHWVLNLPELNTRNDVNPAHILGGAYRLSARYLLDGGLPSDSLRLYWKAMRAWPGYTLQHWHRIVYAILRTMGFSRTADMLIRLSYQQTESRRDQLSHTLQDELNQTINNNVIRNPIDQIGNPQNAGEWPGLRL